MSKDLVSEFRVGHQTIIDIIEKTQSYTRSYLQGKPNIRAMREIILKHFERENEQLYAHLQSFYHEDRAASKIIEFLVYDLKDTKIQFLVFFDKYTGEMGDMGSRNFLRDFTEFSRVIVQRIKAEEEYLFPLLAKLPDEAPETAQEK